MPDADQQIIRARLKQGISKNASHIFRDREGHLNQDTPENDMPENRQLFIETALEPQNYLGADKYGTQWYAKTLSNGEQIWVQVRKGEIRNAGRNLVPKAWHPDTGLSTPM